ncbi:aminoglycoside phosphotransferase family protein [Kineosporia succinea]|uniref:Serine/threonine protein kinase n=1 Tax=Kineosporia succinea TaxID=84632 RepID=A0ABT9PFN7_9ACTN|nr:aminoglycoside phosphotransferase family protein [Kineosporia succinea]MDP9831272.1 serine/threonine protein kinase [Kineosporia succinea]
MSTRLLWRDLPVHVREAATAWFGTDVAHEASQPSGFSPGLASRLTLGDGRRVFVKAVGSERNPDSPRMYRRELAVMRYLPEAAPAPRLLWAHDDGDWVLLVLEDVDGHEPALPWRADDLDRVLEALGRTATLLTPAPADAPSLVRDIEETWHGWRSLATLAGPGALAALDPWAASQGDRLVGLELAAPAAARGNTLLHGDIRADNLLLTASGEVVVVDWPHAAVGAAWCDVLFLLPSAVAAGGVDPERAWARFGPARDAAPADVDAVLAGLAGYFLYSSTLPAPKNVPGVRRFQAQQGHAALAWLRQRLEQPRYRQ